MHPSCVMLYDDRMDSFTHDHAPRGRAALLPAGFADFLSQVVSEQVNPPKPQSDHVREPFPIEASLTLTLKIPPHLIYQDHHHCCTQLERYVQKSLGNSDGVMLKLSQKDADHCEITLGARDAQRYMGWKNEVENASTLRRR
jgi:hypothetical protein